jgi:predicted kinase
MSPQPVLILTGSPGAGKTTAAKLLADRSPAAVHLEADAFFDFIRSGRIEPWKPESQEQNRVVMRIVSEVAAAYAGAGYFTIVDGIVLPRWFLLPLRDALRDAGLEVSYVVLRAPLGTCEDRVETRPHQRLSEPKALAGLFAQFEDLGEFERNALDVEGLDPSEVADAVERLLGEKTHLI